MIGRRDVKPVAPLASPGMTESEYQDAIRIERMFGHIQIRTRMRSLAAEYGLPSDCMEPPNPPRWWGSWYWLGAAAARERVDAEALVRAQTFVRVGILHPDAFLRVASVA